MQPTIIWELTGSTININDAFHYNQYSRINENKHIVCKTSTSSTRPIVVRNEGQRLQLLIKRSVRNVRVETKIKYFIFFLNN